VSPSKLPFPVIVFMQFARFSWYIDPQLAAIWKKRQFQKSGGGFVSTSGGYQLLGWRFHATSKPRRHQTRSRFFTRIFTMAFKAKPALSAAGAASASTSSPASAVAALKAKTTAPVSLKESNKGLRGTRRRLSVVSDNKLIEGRAAFCMVSCSFHPTAARTAPCVACVVAEFAKMTFGCDAPSGIATLGVGEEEKTEEHKIEHVIKTYAGVSKKVRALWYPQCPAWLT
jgi:hypothetical protein